MALRPTRAGAGDAAGPLAEEDGATGTYEVNIRPARPGCKGSNIMGPSGFGGRLLRLMESATQPCSQVLSGV